MLQGKVESLLKDGVGEIIFSSQKANCLDSNLLKQLIEKIEKLSKSSDCKILYIKSLGKTFCAGAYLEEIKAIKSVSDGEAFFSLFGTITVLLREAPQPVIVRMQGPAIGGGVGILAAADLAYGLKESSVKLSEFEIGIGPFVISPVLEQKIGSSRLMELALSGVWKSSDWCLATGLLSSVSSSEAELNTEIEESIARIKQYSLRNVTTFKKAISSQNLRDLVVARAKIAGQALISS